MELSAAPPRIPRVSESLARINSAIAAAAPRDRTMLEVYRDHWLAEVRNDVPAIMATMPDAGPVSYRFDGVGLLIPDPWEYDGLEQAHAMYRGAAEGGLPMAGPFEEERFAFANWGMVFEGVLCAIVRGRAIHVPPRPLDPDGLYLIRWRAISSHPIDLVRRRMLGEHVFGGSLIGLDAVGPDAVSMMLG